MSECKADAVGTTDAPETDLLRKNFKAPGAAAGEEERHCLGLSTAAWEASGFYRSDPASALQSKILGGCQCRREIPAESDC